MSDSALTDLKRVGYNQKPNLPSYSKLYKFGPGLGYDAKAPSMTLFPEGRIAAMLIFNGDLDCPIGEKMTDASVHPTATSSQNATTCWYDT